MILSKYNTYFPINNSVVVYNTLSNKILLLHRETLPALEGMRLDLLSKELYDTLCSSKMIVSSHIEELEVISQTLCKTNDSRSVFELIVNPTLQCNLSCWYCYEESRAKEYISSFEITGILAYLKNIFEHNKDLEIIKVTFFGGEPMLQYSKVVLPILKGLHEMLQMYPHISSHISATTNGTLLTKERLKTLQALSLQYLQITLDGNKERHNLIRFSHGGDDSYSRIINNIKIALSIGICVCLRLNISEQTCLNVDTLLNEFRGLQAAEKEKLAFSIHRVWQTDSSIENEVLRILKEIREANFNAYCYYSNPSSIWNSCYADKRNHITVNPRGRIFKCTARDFTETQIEGRLKDDGTIEWYDRHYQRQCVTPINHQACRECSILPICAGGCSQHLLEKQGIATCPLNMTEKDKQDYAYKVLQEKIYLQDVKDFQT